MNDTRIRIAVSGAGGGVGQSIIKALQDTEYDVVALDGEPLGAGIYATADSYTIPYAADPRFVDRVVEICEKEQCKLFFPGLDAELPILSNAVERFEKIGTRVIVSSPGVVQMSDDKLATYTTLTDLGILVPYTVDMRAHLEDGVRLPPFPFILKKRIGGARSQNMYHVYNQEKLESIIASGIDPTPFVAQEYIEGDEYTCGSVTLEGSCRGVIVMRRVLRDGDTYKCFSVKDEVIENQVRKVANAIKPFGACNVQLRMRDGQPYIFELNARCSGTTAARALCGFNEPKMIADFLCQNRQPEYTIKEQTILRYWQELVVDNSLVAEVKKSGTLHRSSYSKL